MLGRASGKSLPVPQTDDEEGWLFFFTNYGWVRIEHRELPLPSCYQPEDEVAAEGRRQKVGWTRP